MRLQLHIIGIFLLTIFISTECMGQKSSYVWMVGRNPRTSQNAVRITFSENGIEQIDSVPHRGMIFGANSSYCDPETGELLLYSDGFHLFNGEYQLLENGDSLSPVEYREGYYELEEKFGCYVGSDIWNSVVILPIGKDKLGIIHGYGVTFGITDSLFYTEVKILRDNSITEEKSSQLRVIKKNIVIRDDSDGYLAESGAKAAIRHANGRDWWIIIGHARYPTTETRVYKYYVFLLDTTGLHYDHEEVFDSSSTYSFNVWTIMPSKNGSMLSSVVSRYDPSSSNPPDPPYNCFLHLYEFNRCTGNLLRREGEAMLNSCGNGVSCVFSPNGQFIYAVLLKKIIQYQVNDKNWYLKGDTVGRWSRVIDEEDDLPRISALGHSRLGPDGKIYISAAHDLSKYMHVINYPNKRGKACEFEQNGIALPLVNKESIPFYVNYNLGPVDGSACDTLGIDETTAIIKTVKNTFQLYPNPVHTGNAVQIQCAREFTGEISLYNTEGELMIERRYRKIKKIQYKLPKLTPGVYFLWFKNKGKESSKKIVVY